MGIVYRAHDLTLGRVVALKRPRPEVMALPDFTKRFLREARTSSRLLHSNITTVFAAYEQDGVPWLVMELVEGTSLRDRLARGGALPIGEILEHAEGLADALRAAHEQGILHSDVNPNNILIGRDGRARLTDFGLARARNAPGEVPVFGDGDVPTWSTPEAAGTRGYMAPEHLRGRGLDPRSDLYCLGLVLYEMCVGTAVFAGKNTVEWVGAAMDGETERLARLGPEVPPELARIIARATASEPRRRYQSAAEMVADLRTLRRFRESGVEIEVAAAARARKRTHYGVLAAVGVLAVAGAIALATWGSKGPPTLRSRPLTSAPGVEGHPALSPDGRLVAYSSNEAGNADIWVVEVASGEAARLTNGPADDLDPAWLPDGSGLVFVAARLGAPSIWRVSAHGGAPAMVINTGEDPAVSPDGTRVAFAVRDPSGLLRIAVARLAEPTSVTVLTDSGDGSLDHRNPSWSPDGDQICYADSRDLWIVPAGGGGATRLTRDRGGNREPVWSADGRFVYYSSVREGPQSLWRIPAGGGEPVRLTQGTGPEAQPSLSRDGTLLAYATQRLELDIEVRSMPSGAAWRIASSAFDGMPAVDPAGRSVAFVSNRLGSYDLWLQAIGSTGPEGPPRRVTDLPGTVAVPVFSPDGRWLAFHRNLDGERDIWIMPATGGSPTNLTASPGSDVHLSFAPDGRRVVFVSGRAGGEDHLWISDFAGGRLAGRLRQVTSGDTSEFGPSWSPDGRRIAFTRQNDDEIDVWVLDVDSDAPPRRVTHGAQARWVRWGADPQSILVVGTWPSRRVELRRLTLSDLSSEPLDPPVFFGGDGSWADFDLSADGRVLAVTTITFTGDIWLASGM
jgi:eukaryotic-like serine/threonine-protein kinase